MLLYRDKVDIHTLDLGMFDVDEAQRKRQIRKNREMVEKSKDPNASLSKKGSWFLLIIIAAITLGIFFMALHGKIELDRINSETNLLAARLDESQRENARLMTVLEGLATPAKVEEHARENGLMREQVSQTVHIYVNVEKTIEIADKPQNDILGRFNDWFSAQLESFRY